MIMIQDTNQNSLQGSLKRMKLSLIILSLQLAQIASAGDKARHRENDGLGRRQAKSSLQAGQVVRGNRIRARLGSRLLERDFEQEDKREEGDVVTPGPIESSRGIRKGVRKAAKKNNKNTKNILNRLDKAETVHVNKVSGFIRCRGWNKFVHHYRKVNNQNKYKKGEY